MNEWLSVYRKIVRTIEKLESDDPLFRGHSGVNWRLLPTLGRAGNKSLKRLGFKHSHLREENLYFDFVTRSGVLLNRNDDSWHTLFAMQHHGVPTRLLDWTETFSVALYFALRGARGDSAIWILDPFALNKKTLGRFSVLGPDGFDGQYVDFYIHRTKHIDADVVALSPPRHDPRVFHQRSGFTLHNDLQTPLEVLHPDVVHKIIVPRTAREGALDFLRLAGVSEFSLFPDLDALARELHEEYF